MNEGKRMPGGPRLPLLLGGLVGVVALFMLGALVLTAAQTAGGAPLPALLLAAAGALAGAAGALLIARRIARDLAMLEQEADRVRRLDLDPSPAAGGAVAEVQKLGVAMEGMKGALRLFSVYVPRDLVRKLMAEGAAAELGGERRRLTVMFSDVQGFTSIAERMDPEELMRITSTYFQALTDDLIQHHATIDKYIGDAVMAIWNAPKRDLAHAMHACHAVLHARRLTLRLEEEFAARGWPRLHTRFGVHSGDAVVGNVGSTDRMAYTAIGSMVNIASRLEGMNKMYGTQILVSEQTRIGAGNAFVFRPVDVVLAKGTQDPLEVHELLGLSATAEEADRALIADPAMVARLPAWGDAIRAFRAGQFARATHALHDAGDPALDPLVAAYAARLARHPDGPPPGWSPITRLESK
jgi:class 3 adenylate cyclase